MILHTIERVGIIIIVILIIMLYLSLCLFLLNQLLVAIISDSSDYQKVKTECYDRWNNEIEGLDCREDVYCGERILLIQPDGRCR